MDVSGFEPGIGSRYCLFISKSSLAYSVLKYNTGMSGTTFTQYIGIFLLQIHKPYSFKQLIWQCATNPEIKPLILIQGIVFND